MNLDNLTIEEVRAIQIADIRARLAARTPGSWIATLDNHGWCVSSVPDEGTPKERMETLARLNSGSPTSDTADACFIAAAPDDLAILLAEVERLTVERDDLKSAVADLNAGLDAQDQILTNKYNAQLRRAEKAEAERDAAFKRGAEAMRAAAADACNVNCIEDSGYAYAHVVWATPLPEVTP